MTTLTLTPGAVSLADLERVFREECAVRLDAACRPAIEAAQARIAAAAAGETAVYGVNTGFGKLASVKIAAEDTATLQRNLILSHCCGVGPAIPRAHARLMMALKLLSLGRGAYGVRLELIDLIEAMLEKGVTPVIPAQGSVGASGDLAPLSHMAAVMMGAGEAEFGGAVMPGGEALAGKVTLNALTSGGRRDSYRREGPGGFELRDLFAPFEKTARLCHMRYLPPFVLHGAGNAQAENRLADHVTAYTDLLRALAEDRVDLDRAGAALNLVDDPVAFLNTGKEAS